MEVEPSVLKLALNLVLISLQEQWGKHQIQMNHNTTHWWRPISSKPIREEAFNDSRVSAN